MLERIVLAAVITFCAYLFLNLSGKSSNSPTVESRTQGIYLVIDRARSFLPQ